MYTKSMDVEWPPGKLPRTSVHTAWTLPMPWVCEDVHALAREDPQAHGVWRFVAVDMDFPGRVLTIV